MPLKRLGGAATLSLSYPAWCDICDKSGGAAFTFDWSSWVPYQTQKDKHFSYHFHRTSDLRFLIAASARVSFILILRDIPQFEQNYRQGWLAPAMTSRAGGCARIALPVALLSLENDLGPKSSAGRHPAGPPHDQARKAGDLLQIYSKDT